MVLSADQPRSRAARFRELDALRGPAALVVVLYHLTTFMGDGPGLGGPPAVSIWWGEYGVQLFFLISGFVILLSARRTLRPSDFVISRVSRIYPVYWIARTAASALLLVVAAPLLAVIAVVIKATDGGPVLFRQVRVGRDGVPFEFLKFRSMVPDAEARLAALRDEETDRGNDVPFKMSDDPRITRPGRILRRYSMDELPQLINVLRGDMSLVGPRPALPHEVEAYDQDALRRLTVRPGITGLWQVSGRSDLSWSETVRLDMYYVDNWSFAQDVQIMVRTVRAVLASDGAY